MERGGRRLAWLEAGKGWPVVLLHGFPLSAEMWRPQLERVPDGWRFIAPDFRGFGRSLPPEGGSYMNNPPITMDDYAADVLSLMDGLELDDAVIGGLSMGGYVAFALYRQAAARVHGLVLADTRPQADTPQGREGRVRMREVLAAHGPAGVADQMLPKLIAEPGSGAGPDAVRQTRAMIESASADAIDAAIGALLERADSTPTLAAISCATLVVVGERDEITPVADSEAMQRAIPRATLVVLPGAGHLSNLEQPEPFSQALADFLLGHV